MPRKILQENPRENPPKFIQQKSSNTFLQIAQGKNLALYACFTVSLAHPTIAPRQMPGLRCLSNCRNLWSTSRLESGLVALKTGPLSLSLSLYIYMCVCVCLVSRYSLPSLLFFIYIIYIYIYAVKLLSGPSLGFLNVIIWSKLGFLNVIIWSKFVF